MRISATMTACFLTFGLATPAAAELTVEEITALFNKQVEVQNQPLTRSLPGLTARGLSLVTVDDVQAEPVETTAATPVEPLAPSGVQAAQSVTAPTGQTDTATGTTTLTQDNTTNALKPLSSLASSSTADAPPSAPEAPLIYAKYDDDIGINLHIKFGFDSAALTSAEQGKLSTMCTAIKASAIPQFRIIGHTDTSGADTYNERLSILRAKEVARHLVENCGIAANRLQTIGMGERFPLDEANPRADENRRVEFQALS